MNSMSKNYYDSCKQESCNCNKPEPCKCRKPEPCEKECKICPTIIKCGCPSSVTLPTILVTDLLQSRTFNVGSVTVDTSCLCNPITKLEFSSNIVTAVALPITLNFQVFKLCRCQTNPIPVGPVWTYSRLVGVIEANTFSFDVCDCNSCFDDCCTYTVVVTVIGALAVGTSITNGTLIATSTCSTGNCC